MGKWYNHRIHIQYKKDLKVDRGHELDKYLRHVPHIANTFPRNSIAIGCLDVNDLIQAGNLGLVEAWKKVDWDRIYESENPQGQLWSFLKIRIKFAIRQEINMNGHDGARIPTRDLKEASKKMTSHEKILVNIFPKFFGKTIATINSDPSLYRSLLLEDIIVSYLEEKEKNYFNIDVLLQFYGIGYEKLSTKEIADKYDKKAGAIAKIIERTKRKLKNDEFRKIIENFYEKQS